MPLDSTVLYTQHHSVKANQEMGTNCALLHLHEIIDKIRPLHGIKCDEHWC